MRDTCLYKIGVVFRESLLKKGKKNMDDKEEISKSRIR